MSQENKIPSNEGVEFRGGKQIQHVKPVPQNQTGNSNSNNSNQGSTKK